MGKVTNNFPKKTYFCLINLYAMKITIVSGARPNFMKIAPITRAIKAAQEAGKKISYRLIYTGRQDDTSLDASLFSDLDMKRPDGYLGVTGHDHSEVAAAIMLAFEKELNNHPAQLRGMIVQFLLESKHNGGCHFRMVVSGDSQITVRPLHVQVGKQGGIQTGIILSPGVDETV